MAAVGLLAALVFFWYPYARHLAAPYLMGQTVYGHVVLTLVFLTMGIELRRESRREHLDDLFAVYSPRASFFPCAQLMAVCLLAAGVTLLLCVGFAVPLLMDGAHILWLRQVLLQTVLLYFLPCFGFGAAGLLISHLIPGKNVYLAAVAFWLPTSSVAVYFMGNLAPLFPGWRLFSGFVSMGLIDYRYAWNFVSGPPIEAPRWVARGTLCLLAAVLYILCYRKDRLSDRRTVRRAKWGVGAAVFLGAAALAVLCARYQVFFTQFSNDMMTYTLTYEKSQEYHTSGERAAEKNITIQETDISLSCTTQGLAADVTLTAKADSAIERQAFTLFSDLTVDEVLVDGAPADWERVHDGLTVRFPAPKAAGEAVRLTFRYHGYGLPAFPVNETTVQLTRAFPWLPWPGVRERGRTEINYYDQNEAFCVADWQQGDPVAYTLRYDGPGGLCTNLNDAGGGRYEGVSTDGVMLYSGMVHSSHGGVDVYMPPYMVPESEMLADMVKNRRALLLGLCERMGVPEPQEPTALVVLRAQEPSWGYATNELFPRGVWWEIHLTTGELWTADAIARLTSAQAMANIAVPYVLSTGAGYPRDVPWFSTMAFSDLLRLSLLAPEMDGEDLAYYAERFQEDFLNWHEEKRRIIGEDYGVTIPAAPEDAARHLDEILRRIHEGENSDAPLRDIYHRLRQGEAVLPAEMIQIIYEGMEA